MAVWYKVHEIFDDNGKRTGFYKLGRHNSKLNELPLILSDHMHPTIALAEVCRYFGPRSHDSITLRFIPSRVSYIFNRKYDVYPIVGDNVRIYFDITHSVI